jgi:outer membrane protein assembly factor BamB
MAILALGISHRRATVGLLERLAFADEDLVKAYRRTGDDAAIDEAVIVSTCNRVEIYTAAEDGVVRCYKADNGELVWTFVTDGAHIGNSNEHIGIWGSPILFNEKIYIGASNHYLYCLTADKGEVVWKYKARAAIWGTSPVVDGRVVFGDKAGWIHLLNADDGKLISELKIGDNVNSTSAVLDGRIYIGAFNGKLYCLEPDPALQPEPSPSPVVRKRTRN